MPDLVTREEVHTLVRNGSQLIEVLDPREYAETHIDSALITLSDGKLVGSLRREDLERGKGKY